MVPFVPRTIARVLVPLAWLVSVVVVSACGGQPAADTPVPPTAPNTALPPSATRTPVPPTETTSPVPPSATLTQEPATSTPSRTARPAASTTPTLTALAATATSAPASATPAASGDFTPTQPQVWNTTVVGGDNQTGTCSAAANAPYGLILLTPAEGTLAMHNTVPEDYVLARLAPNTYQYTGPSALGDGTLTLDVRFTSATTLEMTRSLVPSAEPGCTHQHHYTGTFRNNR